MDEHFCTSGTFKRVPTFGSNVTCQTGEDCFSDFGGWACVPMNDYGSSVPCSGSGVTACAQICGL